MFCFLSVSGRCVTLCHLFSSFSFSPVPPYNFCLCPAASALFCFSLQLAHLSLPFIYFSLFPIHGNLLSSHSLTLSRTLLFLPFICSLSTAVRLASCVSEPMVVCAVHPPASHSAPSFLRQYAGHLGRTALRRELGGGLERDRAFLSLHRTGSLGTHTHSNTSTHSHSDACMHS